MRHYGLDSKRTESMSAAVSMSDLQKAAGGGLGSAAGSMQDLQKAANAAIYMRTGTGSWKEHHAQGVSSAG